MPAAVTMALGPFYFRGHGFGYSGLTGELQTPWAELETAGRLHELQWTGPTAEVVTISGVLFPREFGGQDTLNGIKLAARSGVPLPLVTAGGKYFGLQAIQKVSEDRAFIDRVGVPRQNAYSIEVKRMSAGFSLLSLLGVI